jgi:hypothetical protein
MSCSRTLIVKLGKIKVDYWRNRNARIVGIPVIHDDIEELQRASNSIGISNLSLQYFQDTGYSYGRRTKQDLGLLIQGGHAS